MKGSTKLLLALLRDYRGKVITLEAQIAALQYVNTALTRSVEHAKAERPILVKTKADSGEYVCDAHLQHPGTGDCTEDIPCSPLPEDRGTRSASSDCSTCGHRVDFHFDDDGQCTYAIDGEDMCRCDGFDLPPAEPLFPFPLEVDEG